MNGFELLKLLKNDEISMTYFGGIISKDMLTFEIPNREIFYICNTDLLQNKGLHWVIIYVPKTNEIEYFDSLGKRPSKFFIQFMRRKKRKIIYNVKELQSSSSTACGFYCLYFLYFRCRNINFERIINEFFRDKSINELFIKKFVKESFV